ncbi:serine hydrolase domain-containing protein [Niabella ginsengisoli]|uniref:Beta-lactamase family protein n=1 Tax=Niabella ginsengisoli TaxID=522298 RepID=A0ABS9SKW0_9BACT|nr:beta-lactamase family protein [Niabella ginsengisoli]MCH5598998.1 beta-lactamase family protein [Niabella ginsengisoli]
MRRSIIPLCLALFFIGCKSKSAESETLQADSTYIQLPTPEKLTKEELAGYTAKLNQLFDHKLINRNFNGAVIVAKGGNIVYEKYVGFTDPRAKTTPITDSSSFHLASTSKPFTGMAILKLVQQGKIHLDDDVSKFFPAFPYPGVTVKLLLSHRSGLPNYLYFMEDKEKWSPNQMVSNNDVLDFLIKYKPDLSYRTGTHFSYCNTNYVLLALILEKVTGKPYPEYMNETIFKPLRMKHTFVYTPTDSGRVIMSYKPSGAIWDQDIFDHTYGDKNIYSTPRDMLKWDAALYSEKFISQSLLDSAYQPMSNETPSTHNYGLAWRMLNLPNGKKVIYHNGKWHGFNPAFARLIDEKAVIIILGNQYNSNIYHSAKLAYNVFGDYLQNDTEVDEDAPVAVTKKKVSQPAKKQLLLKRNHPLRRHQQRKSRFPKLQKKCRPKEKLTQE